MRIFTEHSVALESIAALDTWESSDLVLELGQPSFQVARCEDGRYVRRGDGTDVPLTYEVSVRIASVPPREVIVAGATMVDALSQAGTVVNCDPLLESSLT